MQKEKRYEILDGLPPYGPMYVPIPANSSAFGTEGFVVRFFKADGTDWVANFERGYGGGACGIYELKDSEQLLIISFGECYIMNTDDPEPISKSGGAYKFAAQTEDGRIVLVDDFSITIMEVNGTEWTEEIPGGTDCTRQLKLEGSIITGESLSYYDQDIIWHPFKFNIDTKEWVNEPSPANLLLKSTKSSWDILLDQILIWFR